MSTPRPARRATVLSRRLRALACIPSTCLAWPLAATAQAPTVPLDPVVVVGTREPQPLARSTADITLISAETIRDTTADSVEELLRREAGMQVTRNGGPGQTSGYFLRGASTNSTVVLIDGVRVGSATLGQAEFEALSLAQIDHVEVLRGPASSLYGADAVGGVVQIFTRRGQPGSPRVTGSLAVGGERSSQGDLGIGGVAGAFDYAAHIGRERSRGVSAVRPNDPYGLYNPDADGFARNAGSLQLGYTPAAGHRIGVGVTDTRLKTHYDGADYFPPTYLGDPSADFVTDLRTRIASLDYRGEVSSLWTTTAQLAHDLDDSTSGGRVLSRYKTARDQATWQNALNFSADQQLLLGYEFLRERVDADGFDGERARHNNAAVLGYSGLFGAQTVEASVRHDTNSVYGGNTTGSVGYAFALSSAWKLRARAGTTFRAPSFNDLYFPNYGVATIRPERGRSVEVGAEWRSGPSTASATVYRNRMSDLIGYDPDPSHCPTDDTSGCANNTSRARMQGVTLTAGSRWGGLAVRGTVDFLDAKDADSGARLPRRSAHQESLIADYATGPWSVGGSIADVGSRPDSGTRLGGYAVVDLRTGWRFLPQWRLEAKLLNALDHRVEPALAYQGLGRQAWLGIRYDGNGL